MNRAIHIVLLLVSWVSLLLGEQNIDSTKTKTDTLKASAVIDSTKNKNVSSVDTLVTYSARDSIIYSLRTRFMYLYGKSEMQYQSTGLKAERVDVNWDDATLQGFGVPDTAKKDSVIGKPIMQDGGDEYHGDKIAYNFKSRKGKITVGTTRMDNGYYIGKDIKKVEPDVLCVADGKYTLTLFVNCSQWLLYVK